VVPPPLAPALRSLAGRSAAPELVAATFGQLTDSHPETLERLVAGQETTALAERVAIVAGASTMLARLLVRDPAALDTLEDLERPASLAEEPAAPEGALAPGELADRYQRAFLRVAARDLLGLDDLPAVGAALAGLAAEVLDLAVAHTQGRSPTYRSAGDDPEALAVIGMGKLGGAELNYASDVDVVLVGGPAVGDEVARRAVATARSCFRVDLDLRPEGRSGPILRTLDSYRAYWDRWVQPWERQALLKARPVAGDRVLGDRFAEAAAPVVWDHPFSADELADIRRMKARTEALVRQRGLGERDLKRGPGGIRDVEFAVQLLQLVHGRLDPGIRSPTTLTALAELAEAGYIAREDAAALAEGYRFLRTVEHRLQLVEGAQVHALPTDPAAFERLARVMGYAARGARSASDELADALRHHQAVVRTVHERLYFRPLLEAFAAVGPTPAAAAMPVAAVTARLEAFGFAGVERTRDAVQALAQGLTRRSRLMGQLLPLVLDWLSEAPDPDLGLQQLRDLAGHRHHQALLVATFRESPEAARRLCLVLGSSRLVGEGLARHPDLLLAVGDDTAILPLDAADARATLARRAVGPTARAGRRGQLLSLQRQQLLRTAIADLLGLIDVPEVARALTASAEAVLEAAMAEADAPVPWCAIGLGRFGGAELAYGSDLDLVLVCDGDAAATAPAAERLLALLHGPSPAQAIARVDLALRPEGGQGRLVRDLESYRTYFARWTQTWERQAMLRARFVAGDPDVGRRFVELVDELVFGRPFTDADELAIRRMKARVERERIAPREDPRFHLKLGPGALADVEWTVQLLQLRHRVGEPGTMAALHRLADEGHLAPEDAATLAEAYRFCEHTRNRWHLIGALPGGTAPGDALPAKPEAAARLARSLGTTPSGLRDDYLRVTRRSRRVVERLFYAMAG
jgi:glutamate-ammonia-ligase adenylyltransferase